MPFSPDNFPASVLTALQRGNQVEAIKLLRESTGLGLKEAKDAIDTHLSRRSTPTDARVSLTSLPTAVTDALRRGDRVEAVRLIRESGGLGLMEAKEAIESFQREHRDPRNRLSPGEMPPSHAGKWLFFIIVVAAAIGDYYFGR